MFALSVVDMCHFVLFWGVPDGASIQAELYFAFACGLYIQVWVDSIGDQCEVMCHLSVHVAIVPVGCSLPLPLLLCCVESLVPCGWCMLFVLGGLLLFLLIVCQ